MRRRSVFSLERLEARDTPSTVAFSAAIVSAPAAVRHAGYLGSLHETEFKAR